MIHLKYSKEERLEIGRRIYVGELSTTMAAKEYDINYYTARGYLRSYKAEIHPEVSKGAGLKGKPQDRSLSGRTVYEDMSKEELIEELMHARINEERAKKGYVVKGVGANKEFIPLYKQNMK